MTSFEERCGSLISQEGQSWCHRSAWHPGSRACKGEPSTCRSAQQAQIGSELPVGASNSCSSGLWQLRGRVFHGMHRKGFSSHICCSRGPAPPESGGVAVLRFIEKPHTLLQALRWPWAALTAGRSPMLMDLAQLTQPCPQQRWLQPSQPGPGPHPRHGGANGSWAAAKAQGWRFAEWIGGASGTPSPG